jgi:hypothetical protein
VKPVDYKRVVDVETFCLASSGCHGHNERPEVIGVDVHRTAMEWTQSQTRVHHLAQGRSLYANFATGRGAVVCRVLTRQTPYSFPLPTGGDELVYGRP